MAGLALMEIISPGLLTTVQDLGRFGFGRYGVAPSGALDAFALRIGNLLVGNTEDQAGIETTLLGLRIRALTDSVIAVTGADLQPQHNKRPLAMWCAHSLRKDDELAFRGPVSGCRAYITVKGGLDVLPILGSRSTNLSSAFGGFEGRPLQTGDILRSAVAYTHAEQPGRKFHPDLIPVYPNEWVLRVLWGPQDDHFSRAGRQAFRHSIYRVSPQSDRTGIRLEGPRIERKPHTDESIISEGLISGAIQVPGDGQPIIILGETVTGGYRKIATVIAADLSVLGQIKPGDAIRFEAVSIEEAHQALRAREALIARFKTSLT
ncbi:MAG: biotin-dependent carboxyltransferase family protein [Desulfobacterales bacterium]|nr:MAG: biotin-dependent carboxyltransferase family protein [Desulfobacterales bacterium]